MTDERESSRRWLTVPNLITAVRILGSPLLVLLAWLGQLYGMLAWTTFLVFTEWLDGFLARRLRIASAVGARLDTLADAIFYSCLLGAMIVWRPTLISEQMIWIAAAILSYGLSWVVSWVKFGCLPSYHTWAAKGVWILVGVGVVWLLANGNRLPFRVAMACVALANLEATCMTLCLARCQVDVPSLWHVLYRPRPPHSHP